MDNLKANEILDLKGVPCPQNSARTLLKLNGMDSGEILEVIVDDGEPIENVPSSLEDEGYKIIKKTQSNDSQWHLFVKVE